MIASMKRVLCGLVVLTVLGAAHAAPPTEVKVFKEAWESSWFKDAKVGDYVVYEAPSTAGLLSRQEVTAVTTDSVSLTQSTEFSGRKLPGVVLKYVKSNEASPTVKVDPKDAAKVETKKSTETVKVGSKDITAEVIEHMKGGKTVSKTWMSKDVPCGGLIMSEVGGMVSMKLREFGRGK